MFFTPRRLLGFSMVAIAIILFLVEFKALPHRPKNPEKWDELHAKYYRQIKLTCRVFFLLGLTFSLLGE